MKPPGSTCMVALLFLRFEDRFSSPANLHPLSAYNLQGGGRSSLPSSAPCAYACDPLKLWNIRQISLIFTALHGMQTRSSDENSVCPSVCLSNAYIVTTRKKDLSIFLYHTKDHLAYSFLRRRMVGGGDPFYLKFWVNRPPLERNRRFWTDIRF